jgi:Txe/YoeB family toxin of toxin-antitoxin system
MHRVDWTNQANKDADICRRAGYGKQLAAILKTVKNNPYDPSQGFKRLKGELNGFCSRRISLHNRFVYEVLPNTENARDDDGDLYDGIVRVYEAWGHKYKTTYLLL